jgi:tripartite-type tricarboxylate transporter receptor subunit TctC
MSKQWRHAAFGFAMALVAGSCVAASALEYPTRPVRIIDGFPPGGGTDTLSRTLSQKFSESWGQPVIVDNRPGASSNVGAQMAAKANPDGYTMFMGLIGVLAPSMTLYPTLEYSLLKDFTPVTKVASGIYVVIVNVGLPVKSVKELIDYAMKRENAVRYSSAGVASPAHLAGELFNLRANVKMAHVPYKGGAAATAAIATGEVHIAFSSIPAALPLIQAGKARALAVTPVRTRALQEVPTIAESGLPDFQLTLSYGLLAPAGTPRAVIEKVNAEAGRILKMPEVATRLSGLGLLPDPTTPEKFGEIIKDEVALWARVIKEAKIQVQ